MRETNTSARRERFDWIGDALFHVVHFAAKFGFQVHPTGELPMPEQIADPEPRWRWCHDCGRETVWDGYRWVLEGGLSYECSRCGTVV